MPQVFPQAFASMQFDQAVAGGKMRDFADQVVSIAFDSGGVTKPVSVRTVSTAPHHEAIQNLQRVVLQATYFITIVV